MEDNFKRGFIKGQTILTGMIFYGPNGEISQVIKADKPFLMALTDDKWIDRYGDNEWKKYKEERDNGKQ